jgi:hypothetical protein
MARVTLVTSHNIRNKKEAEPKNGNFSPSNRPPILNRSFCSEEDSEQKDYFENGR